MPLQEQVEAWNNETFLGHLQAIGASHYHDKHPFHRYMNSGQLAPEQVKGWVANRFYYQKNIPLKDAAIIANCPIREVRRVWLHRISDHDGIHEGEGGIEAWLRLAEAVGLSHKEMLNETHVLPGVRFAVDAYVQFARSKPWMLAIASSLTELFAPDLMQERLSAFERFYTWIDPTGLEYFRSRIIQARLDSDQGLALTIHYCDTRKLQEAALQALSFKCDVLWTMLDTMLQAYGAGTGASIDHKGTHLEHRSLASAEQRQEQSDQRIHL